MKYCKVKNVKSAASEPIYHLTVEKNHNFFGNDICLHNCDYRGRVKVIMTNVGAQNLIVIQHGERIAQMSVEPVYMFEWEMADKLSETVRGAGGFGGTGGMSKV